MTELGQDLKCPNVNGDFDFEYSESCTARFGAPAAYSATWNSIRSDIKALFDASPQRCKSVRRKKDGQGAAAGGDPYGEGSVCPPSVLRLGFHISATYDPEALTNVGGSNYAN